MPFDAQSSYAKHQSGCSCEGECKCGKSEKCGCCPVGTVAVTTSCGKHIGCLSPNDAALYAIEKHIPIEGYVKLFHPITGQYLGDVTPQYAIEFMAAIDNTITPPVEAGQFNASVSSNAISMTAPADGFTDIEAVVFSVDRISCTDPIIVQFSGVVPAGVTFLGGVLSLVIPSGSSYVLDGIEIDDQVDAGSFNLTIVYSGCSNTQTQTITVTVV